MNAKTKIKTRIDQNKTKTKTKIKAKTRPFFDEADSVAFDKVEDILWGIFVLERTRETNRHDTRQDKIKT